MRRFLIVGLTFLSTAGLGRAQAPELPAVTRAVDRVVKGLGLDGAALAVVGAEGELHRSVHGDLTAETVLPIASASKWLSVATILTLVDDGKLDLDLPVARYVEEFDRDDRRRITLRQCLSCTGGLPARLGRMRGWDMQQFAREAAGAALRGQPGDSFIYGGVGFQLVAVAAERATEKSWHELFARRIAEPLGLDHTRFGALQPMGSNPGTTELPWVAGGAVSTLEDYTKFVRMLLADGEWQGVRVLSKRMVREMLRDQVPPRVDVHSAALPNRHLRYGLGTWIEHLDDGRARWTDPGAFGFTPWIDPDVAAGGVFAVRDRAARVLRRLERVQEIVHDAVTSPAVAGTVETVRLRVDGHQRTFHLHVPPYAQNEPGLPLLLVLGDRGGSDEQVRDASGLARIGVRSGFAVAFPAAGRPTVGKRPVWTAADVGFLRQVVHASMLRAPIDAERVYAVGFGDGGTMCHLLAAQDAGLVAGIAAVDGKWTPPAKPADRPIATLLVAGVNNRSTAESSQDVIDHYLARNGLVAYPSHGGERGVQAVRYARGRSGAEAPPVEFVRLTNEGRDWSVARALVRFFAGSPAVPSAAATPSVPR